jgi:hypothetical protein
VVTWIKFLNRYPFVCWKCFKYFMLSPFLTFLLAFKFLFYFFFLIFIEVIIFGSIRFLSKKNNQTEIKKKK